VWVIEEEKKVFYISGEIESCQSKEKLLHGNDRWMILIRVYLKN
jgi:hypothetical protein